MFPRQLSTMLVPARGFSFCVVLNFWPRNQAGSSSAMEFIGIQKCIDFLLGCGLVITAFISDWHTQITSHMKNVLTHIKHYFDHWHLKKSNDDFLL